MGSSLEFSVDRTTFLGAIYKVQGIVDRKSTSNILAHVLIDGESSDRLRLVATDYDVTVFAEIPAEVKVKGSACINGKSLFEVVKSLDETPVLLKTLDNGWAEMVSGRSKFKLAGVQAKDFPNLEVPKDAAWLKLPKAVLRDLFEKTGFSMSTDETRMNINGVFLKLKGETAMMVSTDGHRLSKAELAEVAIEGLNGKGELTAIVHKKGVGEVTRRLLEGDDNFVEVCFRQGAILFRVGATTFMVRQIEDSFPDYSRVIPQTIPNKMVVPRDRLIRAIKKIAILTSNKTYIVKLDFAKGRLVVMASNPDYGEGRDELDIEYEGEAMAIGFNYNYLLDVLGVSKSETMVFEFSDEFSPMKVTAPSEPGAVFVVMPMRV